MNTERLELRASGIPWIGTVPSHWEQTQFRAAFSLKKIKNAGMLDNNLLSLSFGRIIPRDIASSDGLVPQSYETYQIVDRDDIIFRFTDLQNDKRSLRSARVAERGIITSAYLAVTPTGIDARYAEYLMRSYDLAKVFYGLGGGVRQSLKFSDVALLPILLPPIDEQQAIADYLDRETQKIDELVTEQRGLIETLRERRLGLIAKAVTRGLNEEQLGESPMPWIGAIPKGWVSGRIKHLGSVALGKMLQSRAKEGDVEAPYMRAANIQPNGVLADREFKTMWFSPAELRSLELRRGDVVVVEGGIGGYGRAAFLSRDLKGWGYQNSVNRIRPFGDGRFIAYYLQAVRAKGLIEAYCNIVSMPHLTAEKLEAMPAPMPPDDEQRSISDYLDEQTARIDELISESEDLIALSQERRAALITAAVTGQIDVRTAA